MHILIRRGFTTLTILAVVSLPTTILGAESTNAPPTTDAFIKTVSALPAEQQVGAVVAKLKELNPDFDGKETHKIENGVVTTLSVSTAGVTDISPVKALRGLRTLNVAPPALNQKGSLENLAPLQGMQLTWLWCHNNPITDLSPLKDMPLTVLSFSGTQVRDLSPLAGMKLQVLSFNDTLVSELGPLEGMPLTVLWCNNTKAADLTSLKAMPLQELKCDQAVAAQNAAMLRAIRTLAKINNQPVAAFWVRVGPVAMATATPAANAGGASVPRSAVVTPPRVRGAEGASTLGATTTGSISAKEQIRRFVEKMKELNSQFDGQVVHEIENGKITKLEFLAEHVTDIGPIREFRNLRDLVFRASDGHPSMITDLSALQGLPLERLSCERSKIDDLTPLKGMKLRYLLCRWTRIRDLSPLQGMPRQEMDIVRAPVADLSPLQGMKLIGFGCAGTKVSDISILKGMPLRTFICVETSITDLTPLKGMPLTRLRFARTQVTDYSVLRTLPLKEVVCDFVPERDEKILRSIRTLEAINNLPAKEFWKRVAAGESPQAK